jgi:hypothetical protein
MRSLLFSVLFALALAGCGGPRLVPYAPLEKKTGLDSKKLYDATEGTLLDRGYLIETRDETGFKLETKTRTLLGSDITQNKFKYAWSVETAGGTLKIALSCKEASGTGSVSDCGKDAPDKLVAEQRAIADQAIKEAKGE